MNGPSEYCPRCGKPRSTALRFCRQCGYDFEIEQSASPNQTDLPRPSDRQGVGAGHRSLKDDLKRAKEIIGYGGTALVLLVLGAPAALSTILGAENAADPTTTFLAVLIVTLPLSLGVSIGIIGLPVAVDKGMSPWVWIALVALGALSLSGVLGGAAIRWPSASNPITFAINTLGSFLEAYGPVGFIGAFIAGLTLAYLFYEVIAPKLGQGDYPG